MSGESSTAARRHGWNGAPVRPRPRPVDDRPAAASRPPAADAVPPGRRPAGAPAMVARALREGLATLRLWREVARQRRQLAELDDRLLKDVGLTRADVGEELRKPFWRI